MPKKTQTERDNARVGKAHRRLERAESRLVRAQNEWQKARKAMRELCARLDKRDMIGGKYDIRELMEPST